MSVHKLKQNLIIAALSLAYAHKSGYKVRMYTDSLGKALLSKLPYDSINTELDSIKLPKSSALWSVVKYYALYKEPLGTIHTDFDVMLKKPCLEGLLDNADATCQIFEHVEKCQPYYEQCRTFLISQNMGDLLDLDNPVKYACNVGIIGYGSEKMREAHAGIIMQVYERLKHIDTPIPTVDFYMEQAHLYHLSLKGFKVNPIIKDKVFFDADYTQVCDYARRVGYCHLQSSRKYSTETMEEMVGILKIDFPDIYSRISDIIAITDI